ANDGGRIRTFNILKRIAQRHQVTLITFADPDEDAERLAFLREICCDVIAIRQPKALRRSFMDKLRRLITRTPASLHRYDSPEMRGMLRNLLKSGEFEAVHVDQIYLAQYVEDLAPM